MSINPDAWHVGRLDVPFDLTEDYTGRRRRLHGDHAADETSIRSHRRPPQPLPIPSAPALAATIVVATAALVLPGAVALNGGQGTQADAAPLTVSPPDGSVVLAPPGSAATGLEGGSAPTGAVPPRTDEGPTRPGPTPNVTARAATSALTGRIDVRRPQRHASHATPGTPPPPAQTAPPHPALTAMQSGGHGSSRRLPPPAPHADPAGAVRTQAAPDEPGDRHADRPATGEGCPRPKPWFSPSPPQHRGSPRSSPGTPGAGSGDTQGRPAQTAEGDRGRGRHRAGDQPRARRAHGPAGHGGQHGTGPAMTPDASAADRQGFAPKHAAGSGRSY